MSIVSGQECRRLEPLLSIQDLCVWLNISRKTIYVWTSQHHNGFPFFKVGKHLRFRASEVEAWLRKYHGSAGVREFAQPMDSMPPKNVRSESTVAASVQ